jgi:phosphopantetheinyl transferase (holo-ACP synthase)
MSLLHVSAKLFPLKESARWAVCTDMSLLQWTSRAVCTERKRQPSCLRWDEFTTVYQPSCFHWKKAPAELFALKKVKYSITSKLFERKGSNSWAFCPEMSLLSVSARMYSLKESARRAVCARVSLLQYTSRAVCTERKRQLSYLRWDEFATVYQPSCFHWKNAPAELFALKEFTTV